MVKHHWLILKSLKIKFDSAIKWLNLFISLAPTTWCNYFLFLTYQKLLLLPSRVCSSDYHVEIYPGLTRFLTKLKFKEPRMRVGWGYFYLTYHFTFSNFSKNFSSFLSKRWILQILDLICLLKIKFMDSSWCPLIKGVRLKTFERKCSTQ